MANIVFAPRNEIGWVSGGARNPATTLPAATKSYTLILTIKTTQVETIGSQVEKG